jgi:hypothetical protein
VIYSCAAFRWRVFINLHWAQWWTKRERKGEYWTKKNQGLVVLRPSAGAVSTRVLAAWPSSPSHTITYFKIYAWSLNQLLSWLHTYCTVEHMKMCTKHLCVWYEQYPYISLPYLLPYACKQVEKNYSKMQLGQYLLLLADPSSVVCQPLYWQHLGSDFGAGRGQGGD